MQPPFLTCERQQWSRTSRVVESGDLSSNSQNASSFPSRQRIADSGYHLNQHDPTSKVTTAHEFRYPTSTRHIHEASSLSRRQDDVANRGESDFLTSEGSTDGILQHQQQQQQPQRHHQHQLQKGHPHHHVSHVQQQQRLPARRRRQMARGGASSSSTLRSQSRRDRQRMDPMGSTNAHGPSQRSRHATSRLGSQKRFTDTDAQMTLDSTGDMVAAVSSSETKRITARHASNLDGTVNSFNFPPQNKPSSFMSKSIGIGEYTKLKLIQ
ncbi:unnamed protein product [Schistocephalus solidus]|uniref:Uncharacterized protein n=1 Tax=Schistocephalus solidus TaxID=70667 RepID=A0A183SJT0_SCHSO|nr:unnamed protein product [Schistocephalus solidus]